MFCRMQASQEAKSHLICTESSFLRLCEIHADSASAKLDSCVGLQPCTDIVNGIGDALALAVTHALESKGEAKLVAKIEFHCGELFPRWASS